MSKENKLLFLPYNEKKCQNYGLRTRWERFPATLAIPKCISARARAAMHARIADYRFPLKSVVGKTFLALPALRIWSEANGDIGLKDESNKNQKPTALTDLVESL